MLELLFCQEERQSRKSSRQNPRIQCGSERRRTNVASTSSCRHRAIDELAATMNSFRVARAALRVRPTAFAAPLARRGYADVAADKIQLSLSLPHQVRLAQSTILAQSETRQKENGKRWTCANVYNLSRPSTSPRMCTNPHNFP